MIRASCCSVFNAVVGMVCVAAGFAAPLWFIMEVVPKFLFLSKIKRVKFFCNLMVCFEFTQKKHFNSKDHNC